MADQELEILIKTLADEHGAEAVEDALKNVRRAQDQNTESSKVGERQAFRMLGVNRELRHVFGMLAKDIPAVGDAMAKAFTPTTLLAALAAREVYKAINEEIGKLNKQLDELSELAAGPLRDIGRGMWDNFEATEKTRIAFEDWVKSLVDNSGEVMRVLTEQLDKIDAEQKALERIAELQGKEKPDMTGARREAVSGAFLQVSADRKTMGAEIDAQQRLVQQRKLSIDTLNDEIKKREENAKKYSDLAKEAAKPISTTRMAAYIAQGISGEQAAAMQTAEVNRLKGVAESNQRSADKMRGSLHTLTAEQETNEKELKRLEDIFTKLTATFAKLSDQMEKLNIEAGVEKQYGPTIKALEERQKFEKARMTPIGQIIERGESALNLVAHGKKLDESGEADRAALIDLLDKLHMNDKKTISIMETHFGKAEQMSADIEKLQRKYDGLARGVFIPD